jgi:glycosyltransferase involved in cell wall biosynthesis
VETIVVDDGSTDGSREIILSYGDDIIPVFKNNGGQGSAYNAGFSKSKGDFVCNLDSDDLLFPEAVEKAVSLFDDQKIIKVQWPLLVTDKDGKSTGEITTKWTPPEGDLSEMVLKGGPFYDSNLHTGSMVKRNLLERILPMPEGKYKNGGDVYVTTLAPLFGHIRNCIEPLGTYRIHGSNHYKGRELDDDRVKNYIARFEANCSVLELHARKLGFNPDQELWKQSNFNFLWPHRLLQAKEDIKSMVSEGERFIMVNGDEWGKGELVEHRKAIPFLQQDGTYIGLPADDEAAITGLEGLRKEGVPYFILWWTSFWWFDHYSGFHQYLNANYKKVLSNERLIIFDLNQPSAN